MLRELAAVAEALIDVVSGCDALQTAEHSLTETDICAFDKLLQAGPAEHRVQLIKPQLVNLTVFIAQSGQLAGNAR